MNAHFVVEHDFGRLLLELMEIRDVSQAELCRRIGRSHSFLTPVLSGKSTPTYADTIKICWAMNVTPNYFAGLSDSLSNHDPQPQIPQVVDLLEEIQVKLKASTNPERRPTVEQIDSRYYRGQGRIEAFSDVEDYFDEFELPSATERMIVLRAGRKSLSTLTVGGHLEADPTNFLQAKLDEVKDQRFNSRFRKSYEEAERLGYYSSIEKMNIPHPDGHSRLTANYKKYLYLVGDFRGKLRILNFSKLIT